MAMASALAIDQEAFDGLITVLMDYQLALKKLGVPEPYMWAAAGHLTIAFALKARGKPCPGCGRMDDWLGKYPSDPHVCDSGRGPKFPSSVDAIKKVKKPRRRSREVDDHG